MRRRYDWVDEEVFDPALKKTLRWKDRLLEPALVTLLDERLQRTIRALVEKG